MGDKKYLKTMIDVVKYEDYDNKSELLSILRNSEITYSSAGSAFATRSYQRYENVDLRVPVPMIKRAKELKETLESIAESIYIETDEYDFGSLLIKPRIVEDEDYEIKEHDVVFDEIQDMIIQGIRNAKHLIWVAVAWFTDKIIYEELAKRKNDGLNIRVIISDDKGNNTLESELVKSFDTKKIPKSGHWGSNAMHDKFCIIDLEYVMHGSYNWSKNAQNNKETLATALDRDFVCKFADEFNKLYTSV
jgi:phosphatidylserine/phosphatidylglycerophosphate/cardiolipin synthase-like enzyme